MYQDNRLLMLYVEESLHAGTGRGLGAVDLPIQRERTTDYPMVQASGIKGKLRAECDPEFATTEQKMDPREFVTIFGHDGHDFAGALSVGDAAILLFPVRSLNGVFAWTTSADVLERFQRTLARLGWQIDALTAVLQEAETLNSLQAEESQTALVSPDSKLVVQVQSTPPANWIVLEDNSFHARQTASLETFGKWLAQFLPNGPEYASFRENLPRRLCILPNDAFRDFARYGTEIRTHVRLDRDTKTVMNHLLWTSESLPGDALLYAPLLFSSARSPREGNEADILTGDARKATSLASKLATHCQNHLNRLQLGGDETTGEGFVAIKILAKEEVKP